MVKMHGLLLLLLLLTDSTARGLVEIDVARGLREFALGFKEAGLEVNNVISQLVVLGLEGFKVFAQQIVIADLLFEFLNVTFFALSERSLFGGERVVRC